MNKAKNFLRIGSSISKNLRTQAMGETSKNDSNLMKASDKWFNRYEAVQTSELGIFKGVTDRFNGITIDSLSEAIDSSQFDEILAKSLNHWTVEKRRAIWFRVHRKHASWVPSLIQSEFFFHHARDDIVVLYKWLPKSEPSAIPPFAHTMVGVGALVINEKNQILVVSEKNALIKNSWKLPGGYLEMNENLTDAAIREVLEETNIKTRFESLISLRHAHGAAFGCSDLYIIMKLIPETEVIRICEREISSCMWMDIDEYMNHPAVHQTNRSFVQNYMELKKNNMIIDCADETHQILKKKYNLFFPKSVDSKQKL